MTRKLLVIGERSRELVVPGGLWANLSTDDPFRWLVNSRVLGAFCSSRSAATLAGKLSSVGVDLGDRARVDSLNLLPPDPRPGAWDPSLARSVADELRVRLWEAWLPSDSQDRADLGLDWGKADWQRGTWRYSGVVLCGRRAAEAMGVGSMDFWSSDGGTVLVPHPSGLSREWNNLDVRTARFNVERWINTLPTT